MISVESLSVEYGNTRVLHEVSIDFEPGKITSILGPNGSGKSTILKAITGMIRPSGGRISLDGRPLAVLSRREQAKALCMVSQHHDAPADVSVEELVGFGRHPHHRWFSPLTAEDRKIVDSALEQTGLDGMRTRVMSTLSGGEAQRAWIAMALAQRPRVLLLDEPTTYLDIAHQLDVLDLVARVNAEQNLTVVMVLHDLNQASTYSDKLVLLKQGRLVATGDAEQILTHEMLGSVYNVRADIDDTHQRGRRIFPTARI